MMFQLVLKPSRTGPEREKAAAGGSSDGRAISDSGLKLFQKLPEDQKTDHLKCESSSDDWLVLSRETWQSLRLS